MEEKLNSDVKELHVMNWQIVERMLVIFYEFGSLKKSQIALKSGLKYDSCMRYLKWMHEKMDFIKFELDHDDRYIQSIHLISQGIIFCKNKIFEKENAVVEKNDKFYLLKNITHLPARADQ